MARPKRELSMARCAASAVLAAIEIYNKPTFEHREQTFALLMVNAWEILLKARLVQQAGGKMAAIYRREDGSRRYQRDSQGEPRTIGLADVLGRADIPREVRVNISGLVEVRNRAAHLGLLAPDARQAVLAFGTASVQNFLKTSLRWFGEAPEVPYLLPVGFLGHATATARTPTVGQRALLDILNHLSEPSGTGQSEYAVVMHVDIELNRGFSGGGNIGFTRDPAAPTVRMSDDEALRRFPTEYRELVGLCRERYVDFKKNKKFNDLMKEVHEDPQCAYERRLDPTKAAGVRKRFYNVEAVFSTLDFDYTRV